MKWKLSKGTVLWTFAFMILFYLLLFNREEILEYMADEPVEAFERYLLYPISYLLAALAGTKFLKTMK